MTAIWTILGGGLGAMARFVVDGELTARLRLRLPWAICAINVVGSFVLGLLAGAVAHGHTSAAVLAIVGTGFCGGFTTFSTAAVDVARLLVERRGAGALTILVGTAVAAVGAAALGLALAA